jgi:hypothetical protein
MNFFDTIKNALIEYIFFDLNFYESFIGNYETFQQKTISFLIDFISFIVPLSIVAIIFIIPLYFILKAFNKLIKSFRTNVVSEEKETRFKRKK